MKDLKFVSIAWSGLAKLSAFSGKLDKALEYVERALEVGPDNLVRAFTLCTLGQIHLMRGDLAAAETALADSATVILNNRLRNDYVSETWVAAAELEIELYRRTQGGSRAEVESAAKSARRAVKRARRVGWAFPNYRPAILRVEAMLAALDRPARAQEAFEQAAALAQKMGQRYELGRIHAESGRAALDRGDERRAEQFFERAEAMFRALGAQHDQQRMLERQGRAVRADTTFDRQRKEGESRQIASLYRAGELLSSLRDVDRLLDKIMDVAIEATGAERGLLLLNESSGTDAPKLGIRAARNLEKKRIDFDPLELRQEVVAEVAADKVARIWSSEEAEPSSAATEPGGRQACSILCVPLKREERLLGVIYVDNRLIGGLFTRDDLEALSAFAALVAVTLENAYAYRRFEELNQMLEQKVRERTRELEESEERFRRSIDEANDAIVALDPHTTRVVRANRRAAEWVGGGDLDRLIGKTAAELFAEESGPKLADFLAQASEGAAEASELSLRPLDGGDGIPTSLSANLIRVGATGFLQIICRDLREQKRLQRQVLHNEKLASIGQLAAGVAHEIRNPLNGIGLAVATLKRLIEKNDQPKIAEKLSSIKREVDRANKHISDLLTYSRPVRASREPVNLRAVIEEVLSLAGNQLELQNITVERDYRPSRRVIGDPHALGQIFMNLVLNACHAMAAGGTLRVRLAPASDGMVEAEVQDNGSGIAEENLDRIFDPFFTTKEPGKGTGLGLSICQTTVRKMGGQIGVQSKVGEGTCFTVSLPVEGDHAEVER